MLSNPCQNVGYATFAGRDDCAELWRSIVDWSITNWIRYSRTRDHSADAARATLRQFGQPAMRRCGSVAISRLYICPTASAIQRGAAPAYRKGAAAPRQLGAVGSCGRRHISRRAASPDRKIPARALNQRRALSALWPACSKLGVAISQGAFSYLTCAMIAHIVCISQRKTKPMTTLAILCFAAPLVDMACPIRLEWSRHGGLRFWRIGRLGGSFYLARS